ncbi:DUF1360 domain-containing protein [Bacillus sp. A301a_S52]|jgi:hypothetical protein|nr:DUF1360 domain-containing protein [Bacillus sp. A301a_S52]
MMMTFSILDFIVIGLAVFRLTHLFVYDTIMEPVRRLFIAEKAVTDESGQTVWTYVSKGTGVKKFVGMLLSCHWCFSVWVAAGLMIGLLLMPGIFMIVSYVFAFAAIAALIEEVVMTFFAN